MEEYLRRVWEELIGRMHGAAHTSAAVLAIRAGVKDAREGRPAYGWALITDPVRRHALLREGWREMAKVFLAAVIIDLVYEIVVFNRIFPGQALIVAAILPLLPYPLVRGSVNRDEPRYLNEKEHS